MAVVHRPMYRYIHSHCQANRNKSPYYNLLFSIIYFRTSVCESIDPGNITANIRHCHGRFPTDVYTLNTKKGGKWMSLCCTVGFKWVTVMDDITFEFNGIILLYTKSDSERRLMTLLKILKGNMKNKSSKKRYLSYGSATPKDTKKKFI